MRKSDSHIFVGMKRDLSPSRLDDKYLWEAHNIRVKPIDSNNTMGSITNEKGNKRVVTNRYDTTLINSLDLSIKVIERLIDGAVLGYCSYDKYLVLFVHNKLQKLKFDELIEELRNVEELYKIENFIFNNAKYDKIYRIEFVDTQPEHINEDSKNRDVDEYYNGHIVTLLYEGNLNFSMDYPIECFMNKENEFIYKAYWIDGINLLRCINITKDLLIEKYLNRTESNKTAKKDIENKRYGIDVPFFYSRDVYTTRNPFDIGLECDLREKVEVKRRDDLTGVFPPCTIQYALSYYNKYGSETNIIYVSPLMNVSWIDRGGKVNEQVSCSFLIDVKNIQKDFDYLRLYSIKRTILNGTPEAKIVDELAISDITQEKPTKKFYRSDINSNPLRIPIFKGSANISQFNDKFKEKFKVELDTGQVTVNIEEIEDTKSMYLNVPQANNNVRILGCDGITYLLYKIERIQSRISGYHFKIEYNTDNGTWCIIPVIDRRFDYIEYTTYNTDLSYTFYDSNTYGEIIDFKSFIAKNRTIIIPKTMAHFENNLFVGNYDYKIDDIRLIMKNMGYFLGSSIKSDERPTLDLFKIGFAKRSIDLNDSGKDKGYSYSNQLKYNTSYLKWNENYRLGFQCLDRYGKWSDPIWINDIGDNCLIKNNLLVNRPTLEHGILSLPYSYVDLSYDEDVLYEQGTLLKYAKQLMHDLYNSGYRTIRPVVVLPRLNDKHVVALGIITPTVFNDILRVRNSPYALPSWFIRPIMVPSKTDFGKMLFLEYRNMRPLQSARSFTFYRAFKKDNRFVYPIKFYYSAKQVVKDLTGNANVAYPTIVGTESVFLPMLGGSYFLKKMDKERDGLYNYALNAATYVGNEKLTYNNGSTVSMNGLFNFDRKYCEILNTDLLYPFNFLYIFNNSAYYENERDSRVSTYYPTGSKMEIYEFLFGGESNYTPYEKRILALNKLAILALKGRYRVDLSILTFHSPDIEFDEAIKGLYFGNYDILIDGIIPINDDNVSNYKEILTETATIGNGVGFTLSEINGLLVTNALYNDSAAGYKIIQNGSSDGPYEGYISGKEGFMSSGSAFGNWYVYPWLKHGAINNDTDRGPNGGVMSSELKFNLTSSLKFLSKVIYFNKGLDTADDLPIIRGNMYFADKMVESERESNVTDLLDNILGSLCFSEALLADLDTYQAIKIDDKVYFANIDQANQTFSSYSCNPYDVCIDSGCPTVWLGSLFVWDGKLHHDDDTINGLKNDIVKGKGLISWGDRNLQILDRTSGWAYPGFALNTTISASDESVYTGDTKGEIFDYVAAYNASGDNSRFLFPYFDKGLDLNNDGVRIKYKTTPHLVFKFKLYGKKMLDSIFTPDPCVVAVSDIRNNDKPRRPAVRVHAITQSYIDSFDRDEKKGDKKGESAFSLATNQRAIINTGADFSYDNQTFKHNHIYFYTGEGDSGYAFCTNVFDPGTLFVDLNDLYYVLLDEVGEETDLVFFDKKVPTIITGYKVKNKVLPIVEAVLTSPDADIDLNTEPTVAGYEWDKRSKKWINVIKSLYTLKIDDWTEGLIKDQNDNPFLFLVSIVNNRHEAMFGGTSEYAIENNIWIPANTALPIDIENGVKLLWLYGDTWYLRYDCLRTYQNTPDDENQVTEIVSFMAETNINIDGRCDRNRGNKNNTVMTPLNFNQINYVYTQQDNFFSYKILDGDTYKNVTYPTTVIWSLEKHDSSMIDNFSQITELALTKLDNKMGEITDIEVFNNYIYIFLKKGFSRLKYNDTIQLSSLQGTPVEIANSGKVDGYEVLNSNIGCNNKWSVLVTDDMLYFVDSFTGCIYVIPDGLLARKHAQSLSTASSFDTWCRKYYSSDSWKPKYEWDSNSNLYKMIYTGVRTMYDSFNGNIYFTTNYRDINDLDDDKQLMFCKPLMSFESYMPYWKNTVGMFNIDDGLYTITTKTLKICTKEAVYTDTYPSELISEAEYEDSIVSEIWLMWKGEYNKFYDNVEPYSITFVSNKGKGNEGLSLLNYNKIFDNLSFIADVKLDDESKLKFLDRYENDGIRLKEDDILTGNDSLFDEPHLIHDGYGRKRVSGDRKDLRKRNILKKPFDHIRVWNEYLDSTMIPLNFNMLRASNLKLYERVWRVQIPRDKRYKLLRISNPWAYITLAKYPNSKPKTSTDGYSPDDSDNFRMELHNVDVDFFIRS